MRRPAATEYALRALVRLAEDRSGQPVPAQVLAAAEDMPFPYLLGILRRLADHGIVHGRRGRDGGFLLAAPPDEIPVSVVVGAIETHVEPVDDDRPLSLLWRAADAGFFRVLDGVTLQDLADGRLPPAAAEPAQTHGHHGTGPS